MNVKNGTKKPKTSYSISLNLYSAALVFLIVLVCVPIFVVLNNCSPFSIAFAILSELLLFAPLATGSTVLFYIKSKKKYGSDSVDGTLLSFIFIYIFVALILSIFITKFSTRLFDCDRFDKMIQVSWTTFGVSIAVYTIIIGVINSKSDREINKRILTDFLDTINPMIYSLISLIVATIMLYFFYENNPFLYSFCSMALISNLFSIPYYACTTIHLYLKYI